MALNADRASSAGAPKPLAGLDRARAGAGAGAGGTTAATNAAPALPTGLDLRLTPTELANLVAFLGDSGVQDAIRAGRVEPIGRWLVAGPFAPGADPARVLLDRINPTKLLVGQGGRRVAWHPQMGAADGRLDLDGWLTAEPGRLYAATELRTEAAQIAWLSASTKGAARVYLNGARVADLTELANPARFGIPASGPTGGADAPVEPIRLALRAGANLVMVAFDSPSEGQPAATFVVASPRVVEAQIPRATVPPATSPTPTPKPDPAEKPDASEKTGDRPAGATEDRVPAGNVEVEAPRTGAEPTRAPKGSEP